MVILRALGVLCVMCVAVLAQESADDLAFLAELRKDFERGGTYSAQRDLEDYLDEFPDSVPANLLAAQVAYDRGRIDDAARHLDAAGDPDPELRVKVLLRRGAYEQLLEMAERDDFAPVHRARLRVTALDGLGRRTEAKRVAREAYSSIDNRTLDGEGLVDLGWLLLFLRRFELSNQALVFADRELNGLHGPDYRVVHPEALLLLGEVYEQTRQTGQGGVDRTLSVLDDVLKADPTEVEALVIKARAYQYGMNGRAAEQALDDALARDPSQPDALVLQGRTRLLARRPDAALSAAEIVLSANPRNRDALALRAVALLLGGERAHDEAERARKDFDRAHPESNALELLQGEVLQSYYRFADSIAPLEQALAKEPDDERPLPILAQSLANVGRYADARAALTEHEERSPFVFPWRSNMLTLLASLDDKLVVETDAGFHMLLPPGEQDVFGTLLAERLADARADLAERWGYDPPGKVTIEVYDVHGDFSVRTVGFEGFLAFGVCFGDIVTMLSPLSEMRGRYQWAQTALHEYAHVVTLGVSRQRMPRWLSEGVSVWEEKRVHESWARELERDVLNARANGLVFPVTRMDEAFQDGSTVMLGYYLGSLVCEVVEHDFGFPALRALVAAYGDDLSTEEAVQKALGVSSAELDRRLLAYIDTVVAGRAAIRPHYDEHGKERLRRAVLAGDPSALAELAWAYHDLGQTADREATLERALAGLGETPSLVRLLAERDLEAGRRDEGKRRLLAWQQAGDGLEADGLTELAFLQLQDDEHDAAKATLHEAHALFPSDLSPEGPLAVLIGMAQASGDRDELFDLLGELVRYDEASVDARMQLAHHALETGHDDEARPYLEQAVEIEPYDPKLRMELGAFLADHDDRAGAEEQWRLVLGMRPGQMPGMRGADEERAAALEAALRARQQEARGLLEEGGLPAPEDSR